MHVNRGADESKLWVHAGLRKNFDAIRPRLSGIVPNADAVEFIDYDEINTRVGRADGPVMLPVNTEYQADELRFIRAHHPTVFLVAVTHDLTGHSTYYAMRAGANFVINLAIPCDRATDLGAADLRLRATAHERPTADTSAGPESDATPNRGSVRYLTQRSRPPVAPAELDQADKQLIQMLRTSLTVADIARRSYMSERSMYRRIRKLYNALGVTGRTELIQAVDRLEA
ncbi:helix-turn-helix transcriptional regulator [Nocardia tenerifensis]|nr:response regulator transcription factor [Nocardia tenerifensis]